MSIVTDGRGLNITVVSYLDRLDFGFIADRELVLDVWDLADMYVAEIGRPFAATGAEWAEPPREALPRRGPAVRSTVAKPKAKPTSTGRGRTWKWRLLGWQQIHQQLSNTRRDQ